MSLSKEFLCFEHCLYGKLLIKIISLIQTIYSESNILKTFIFNLINFLNQEQITK